MTQGWIDRVQFLPASGGLGDFVVASAVTGYNTPAQSSAVNGVSYHYVAQIADATGTITAWEVGTGVYTVSTTTLARTSIEFSSNANAKVNFATVPTVTIDALAADFTTIANPVTTNLQFYIATTGSDTTGDGTVGNPWATHQHAADYISANVFNPEGWDVHVHVAAGTYDCPDGGLYLGPHQAYNIRFVATTTATLTNVGKSGSLVSASGGVWSFANYTLGEVSPSTPPFAIIDAYNFGTTVQVGACSFGACTDAHMSATLGGFISTIDDITIIGGGAIAYMKAREWGQIHHRHGNLILSIDPAYSVATMYLDRYGRAIFSPPVVTGTSSGPQWSLAEISQFEYNATVPGSPVSNSVGLDCLLSNGGVLVAPQFLGDHGGGASPNYVPAAAAGDAAAGKFLKADASWAAPPGTAVGHNPTATGGDLPINGSATTFLRSDGAFAIQLTSSSQFGLCKVDNSTITASAGVITAVGAAASSIAINVTGVTSGTANDVLYTDSGPTLQQAANFQITSGNPDVRDTHFYAYNSNNVLSAHGTRNIFTGGAGNVTLSGTDNVGSGASAGAALTSGGSNVLIGHSAGAALTAESSNICIGNNAGVGATGLTNDILIGNTAGQAATPSSTGNNLGIGQAVLFNMSTTANSNVAMGQSCLFSSLTGNNNLAIGSSALHSLTSGSANVGIGINAGGQVSVGGSNVFMGTSSGLNVVGGSANVYIGANTAAAGQDSANNVGIGTSALNVVAGAETLSSLTWSGGTATATTTAAHGIPSGTFVLTILLADPSGYNGTYTCTITGASTFTYAISNPGSSPAIPLAPSLAIYYTTTVGGQAGTNNVAIGQLAGASMTLGYDNIFIGGNCNPPFLTYGHGNTVIGANVNNAATSLGNTNPVNCVLLCDGAGTLKFWADDGSTGSNIAAGQQAGNFRFHTGTWNTSIGNSAGASLTTGSGNNLFGFAVGALLTTGTFNTFVGGLDPTFSFAAGFNVTTGSKNTIVGNYAGSAALTSNVVLADGAGNVVLQQDGTDMFIKNSAAFATRYKTTLTDNAAASLATLTNAPAVGNPTKWFAIDDNGTTRYIPAW